MLLLLISILCFNFQANEKWTEEEIYSKILNEYLGQRIDKSDRIKLIVLNEKLKKESYGLEVGYEDIGDIASASTDLLIFDENNNVRPDSIKIDLVNKFERSQKRKKVNLEKIKLSYKTKLISQQEIKEIFEKNVKKGWKKFYRKYRKSFGIVEVSNLVFSEDKRFCILYVGYQRRGLQGYGCLLIVDLEDQQQLIKAEIELWMS